MPPHAGSPGGTAACLVWMNISEPQHAPVQRAVRQAVDEARDKLAGALGAEPGEIVFTSGGTEADNFALIGAAMAGRKRGKDHVITSAVEHHAVLETCRHLERIGFRVTYLPVDETGEVRLDALREAIDDRTALVSVMYGNNEVNPAAVEPSALPAKTGLFSHRCRSGLRLRTAERPRTAGGSSVGFLTKQGRGGALARVSPSPMFGVQRCGAARERKCSRRGLWEGGGNCRRVPRNSAARRCRDAMIRGVGGGRIEFVYGSPAGVCPIF